MLKRKSLFKAKKTKILKMQSLLEEGEFKPVEVGSQVYIRSNSTFRNSSGRRIPEKQLKPKIHTVGRVERKGAALEAYLEEIASWVLVSDLEVI